MGYVHFVHLGTQSATLRPGENRVKSESEVEREIEEKERAEKHESEKRQPRARLA